MESNMPAPTQNCYTAIILAGQRPGTDRLAAHFGIAYKALVPFAGKPMVTHVVRSMHQHPQIARIVILAQDTEIIADAVKQGGGGELRQSNAGISSSLNALLESGDVPWPWLVTTADHPLLTGEMITEFLAQSQHDLSVGMVEKKVMLARYPDAQRTWLRFADGDWSGANLFALSSDKVSAALALWAGAEKDRKQAWKLFLHFGPWLALRALTRTIGLKTAFAQAGKRLGLSAQLVPLSDPVAAIDVDKPEDHALASAIFATRKGL
jgi:GTP:adenosylcobinamide-phosphate guanylyltransferase